MTGTTYNVPPIPPDPDHTVYVDAGVLRIGVEHRSLDDAELKSNYQGDAMVEVEAAVDGRDIQDNGVSLHVCGAQDGHEYLRFDMFQHGPHYHYIDRGGEKQTIIDFDRVALGAMLPWVLQTLRARLPELLECAGGGFLVAGLDAATLDASLVEVEKLALAAASELEAGRQGV